MLSPGRREKATRQFQLNHFRFSPAVSIASILAYVGVALVVLALVFLLIGIARTSGRAPHPGTGTSISASDVRRLRIMQRADWRCAAYLLCAALLVLGVSLAGTGPFFSEASGNMAGGVLLIAFIIGLGLLILLFLRHWAISRALRKLENQGPE